MKLFGYHITRTPQSGDAVEQKLNEISNDLAVLQGNNTADTRGKIFSKLYASVTGGYDFGDTLHNVWVEFGYPATLTFFNFWQMYRRSGIAKAVVELVPDTCWLTNPEVKSKDAAFTRDFETLVDNRKLWQRMKAGDTRNRVGRYSALFMRVRDGLNLAEPMADSLPGVNALVEIVPLYESQLIPATTDQDPQSERFGMPLTYYFNSNAEGNRNPQVAAAATVHWTRVIILAEGADNGGIYGISELEAPWNSLMDLRKISGAGAEGFYKNAAQNIIFELADPKTTKVDKSAIEGFSDNYNEKVRASFLKSIVAPYMKANNLQSTLVNPKDFYFNSLYDVAAAVKIGVTILIGQLTGRLASDEDNNAFRTMCQSRRTNFLTESIDTVIQWCQRYGVLVQADYDIEWDDLLSANQTDKLLDAKQMTEINKNSFMSGGGIIFSDEEIREAAGYENDEFNSDSVTDEGGEGDNVAG